MSLLSRGETFREHIFTLAFRTQNISRPRPADTTVTSSTRTQPSPLETPASSQSQQYEGAKPKTSQSSSSATGVSLSASSNTSESLKQSKRPLSTPYYLILLFSYALHKYCSDSCKTYKSRTISFFEKKLLEQMSHGKKSM